MWVLGSCDLPILEQIKNTRALRVGTDFSTIINNRDGQSGVVGLLIRDEGLVPPDQPQQGWSTSEIRQCENINTTNGLLFSPSGSASDIFGLPQPTNTEGKRYSIRLSYGALIVSCRLRRDIVLLGDSRGLTQ